jgi:cytidylate kinase
LKSIIIGFSGKIGSGKTTISTAVAEALNWPHASFGDYVREVGRERGIEESRKVLQEIGASLVENPDEFCLSLLELSGWKPGQHLVVDGVRHAKIVDALHRTTKPSRVFLVFVEVNEKVRKKRIQNQKDNGMQRAPK